MNAQELIEKLDKEFMYNCLPHCSPEFMFETIHRRDRQLIQAIADIVTEIDYGAMTAREVRNRAVEIINSFAQDKEEHGKV
jgi:hypothetical protein